VSSRTTGQREALADSNFYIDVVRVLAISAQSRSGGDDVCITIETSFSGAPMRAVHWPHVFFGGKKDIIKVGLYFDLRKI